jgi:hypothetical protein
MPSASAGEIRVTTRPPVMAVLSRDVSSSHLTQSNLSNFATSKNPGFEYGKTMECCAQLQREDVTFGPLENECQLLMAQCITV